MTLEEHLIEAAKSGDIGLVEYLVTRGVDVNTVDSEGGTPWIYAYRNGHKEVLNFLDEHGAIINENNDGVENGYIDGDKLAAEDSDYFFSNELYIEDHGEEMRSKDVLLPPYELIDIKNQETITNPSEYDTLRNLGEAVINRLKKCNIEASLQYISLGSVVSILGILYDTSIKFSKISPIIEDVINSIGVTGVRLCELINKIELEVPNAVRSKIYLYNLLEDVTFRKSCYLLSFALGETPSGIPCCTNFSNVPNLLIAGSSSQEKSACINSILISLLFRATPDEVQFILVDPTRTAFSLYADLPHLIHPVITDVDLTVKALRWTVSEIERRMKFLNERNLHSILRYNQLQMERRNEAEGTSPASLEELKSMPYLIIAADEVGDIMMLNRKEVESSIIRIVQLGRAVGIHLIIATQCPISDIITDRIKANFPRRIAFKATTIQGSQTILDSAGAESLLGDGDMLFRSSDDSIIRLHGANISDKEITAIVDYWKKQQPSSYQVDFEDIDELEEIAEVQIEPCVKETTDPIYDEAVKFIIASGKPPDLSLLQKKFNIGFNHAAKLMEEMEHSGVFKKIEKETGVKLS